MRIWARNNERGGVYDVGLVGRTNRLPGLKHLWEVIAHRLSYHTFCGELERQGVELSKALLFDP